MTQAEEMLIKWVEEDLKCIRENPSHPLIPVIGPKRVARLVLIVKQKDAQLEALRKVSV